MPATTPFFDNWLSRQPWTVKFGWYGGLGLVLDLGAIYWATQGDWHGVLVICVIAVPLSGYALSILWRKPAPDPDA